MINEDKSDPYILNRVSWVMKCGVTFRSTIKTSSLILKGAFIIQEVYVLCRLFKGADDAGDVLP
jgi:hypothetical protein